MLNKLMYVILTVMFISLTSLLVFGHNQTEVVVDLDSWTHRWQVVCQVDDRLHTYEYVSVSRRSPSCEQDFCDYMASVENGHK